MSAPFVSDPAGVVTAHEIAAAQRTLGAAIRRTPTIHSALLSERLGVDLHLKLELQQHTGSFKARGAFNRIAQLSDTERARGVITVSAGNHAQAVAWAARGAGVAATVVMPDGAVQMKVDATRAFGAEVVLTPGPTLLPTMQRMQAERNLVFIPPFDDRFIIAGAATCGVELLDDVPDVEVILVGVGGGGIVSGLLAAANARGAAVRIIGVEPEGAMGMTRSVREGAPVRLDRVHSIADGLAAPWAGALNYQHVRDLHAEMVTVTDDAIVEALFTLRDACGIAAEPAAAACLAALMSGVVRLPAGTRVACVVTGGNVDASRLAELAEQAERAARRPPTPEVR